MITSSLEGVDFLAVNTDANSLKNSNTERRIQMGASITSGLGAGASPEIGRTAAKESINEIMEYLKDTNMVFITAGMGGGTGTGGTPVIAKAAREKGILTVGIVTKPFHFEGAHRMELAEKGIEELSNFVDTLIVIPNQNLFRLANENTTFSDAFRMADEVLYSGVRSVTDLITMPGMINLEFADIRSVMQNMGKAMVGTGEAIGNRRAIAAAEAAITNPLLENYSMKSAKGVLINIAGGSDMTLFEVDEAANRIRSEVDENAYIIFGSTFENNLEGKIRVSVIATGIAISKNERSMPRTRSAENSASTPTSTADNTIPQSMKAFSMSEEAASTLLPDEDVNTPIPKKFALYAIEGGLAEISSHSPQTKLEKPVIKRAGSLFKKLLSSNKPNLLTKPLITEPIDDELSNETITISKSQSIFLEKAIFDLNLKLKRAHHALDLAIKYMGNSNSDFPDNKFNQMSLMLSDDFLNELREEKIINEDDLLDIPAFLRRQAR